MVKREGGGIEFLNRWPSWYLHNWWLRLNQPYFKKQIFHRVAPMVRHACPILKPHNSVFNILVCVVCALYNIRPRLYIDRPRYKTDGWRSFFMVLFCFPTSTTWRIHHIRDMLHMSSNSIQSIRVKIQLYTTPVYKKCVVKSLTCSCCCWMGSMHGEKANGGNEVAVTPMQQFVVKPSSLRDSDANWLPPKRFRIEMKTRQFR